MGTIGGSLAHADPAADLPGGDARARRRAGGGGAQGHAEHPDGLFFLKLFTTALGPGEVLTEVRIPLPPAGTGGAYAKFAHPASRFAIVGVAAMVTVAAAEDHRGAGGDHRGGSRRRSRASGTEAALIGKAADAAVVASAAEKVAEGLTVRSDARMDPDYWRALTVTFTRRAVATALERAGG